MFLTNLRSVLPPHRFCSPPYPPVRLCSRRFDKRHECQKLLYANVFHDTTSYMNIRRGWKSHLCNSSTFSLNPRELQPPPFVIVAYVMIARAALCFGLANMFRLAPLFWLIEDHQPCVKKRPMNHHVSRIHDYSHAIRFIGI
jgi:hypothetical protein